MRVAVYGGSFNPPHVGHLMVAAWVRWTGQADEVWLLPTYSHAFAKDLAPFDRRAGWCARIAESLPGVEVCRIEADLPAPSFTIDTLEALQTRHPDRRFRFVLGADQLDQVDQWRRWSDVEARFAPLFVGRQGYPAVPGAVAFPPISSTEVRQRILAREPVEHLVPHAILDEVQQFYASEATER